MDSYPEPLPGKNAIRLEDDPDGIFVTPLQGGIDEGYDNLHVRLVSVPRMDDMYRDAAIGNVAHVGGLTSPLDITNLPLGEVISFNELVNSGLEQTFESQMFSFLVYGCSRGFTHEMVRTRSGASYNQQTFRHTNLTGTRFRMPLEISSGPQDLRSAWKSSVAKARRTYEVAVRSQVPYEDARTVLPLSTETYILVRMPWRTFVDTFAYRACYMFYPEMVWIMHELHRLLREREPELASMLAISCERSKTCTYRGAEPTGDGACPFLWAGRRTWLPDNDKRWAAREYLGVPEWDKKHPSRLVCIEEGFTTAKDLELETDEDGLIVDGSSEWDVRKRDG